MNFEDRIFKNFKHRTKEAFKYHKCENLIPKTDHDQEYEKILGCDRLTYVKYLKSKFKDGMSELNYGIEGWHIDHIFPLARANSNNLIFWLHYLNTQPLWKKQNEDKCDYIFDLHEIRLVEKTICEAKNIEYVDTINPIEVLKFSRPYLKELKNKGQITENDIIKIKEKHKENKKQKEKQYVHHHGLSKQKLDGKNSLNKRDLKFCQENNIPVIRLNHCKQWRVQTSKNCDGYSQKESKKRTISDLEKEVKYLNTLIEAQQKIINNLKEDNQLCHEKIKQLEKIEERKIIREKKYCTLLISNTEDVDPENVKMFEELFKQ